MVRINENYLRLPPSYLFSEIAKRAREFQAANPNAKLMRLGIGNTTEPLAPTVIAGLHAGVDRLAKRETYSGYGDERETRASASGSPMSSTGAVGPTSPQTRCSSPTAPSQTRPISRPCSTRSR